MKPDRILFVDGSSGASGDMILGALVDLGVPLAHIRRAVSSLPVEGWTLRSRRVSRCALAGRKVDVTIRGPRPARGWKAISRILRGGDLEPDVRDRALAIFRRLIEAEAEVHGSTPERVHLHEAGAVDAIVDIVGACVGLSHLAPDRIVVSTLTTGSGTIRCDHGVYPVPAPATLALTRGVPIEAGPLAFERLTPTGAAILTTVADAFEAAPPMIPCRIGHGAGDRQPDDHPNMIRMVLGETIAPRPQRPDPTAGTALVIECTIDDSTPQALAYAVERLREAGALEVFTTATTMKKGRSGHLLTVLCRSDQGAALQAILLRETSTLGLRYRLEGRVELERSVRRVRTPFGSVDLKVGSLDGEELHAWPEYDQCAALARRHGVRLADVQQAALEAKPARPSRSRNKRRGKA